MKTIAVILSGCGYLDGAEITEAISILVAIGQQGGEAVKFPRLCLWSPALLAESYFESSPFQTLDKCYVETFGGC